MNTKSYSVLIVEDDRDLGKAIAEEFEDEGYQVRLVYNGDDALKAIEESRPDAVILDINMPGKDGIETLNAIVNYDGRLPVILHTAYSAYKENFLTWSAVDYVVKSSDMTPLKESVARAIQTGV